MQSPKIKKKKKKNCTQAMHGHYLINKSLNFYRKKLCRCPLAKKQFLQGSNLSPQKSNVPPLKKKHVTQSSLDNCDNENISCMSIYFWLINGQFISMGTYIKQCKIQNEIHSEYSKEQFQ